MNANIQTAVLAAAQAIHAACLTTAGESEGNCKNATLALALALDFIQEPICICQGQVLINSTEHDHYWCRIGHTIVDPTADQFGQTAPLIESEGSLPHYREESFLVFTPSDVVRLLQAARPKISFNPDALKCAR